jgi:hypothetical protein
LTWRIQYQARNQLVSGSTGFSGADGLCGLEMIMPAARERLSSEQLGRG